MKRLLAGLVLVVLAGAGCATTAPPPKTEGASTYENSQYGFAFEYPAGTEVKPRTDDQRKVKYLGLDVDFFASLRDTVKEDKPLNLAFFYAAPHLTVDAFKKALEKSGSGIKVTATDEVTINGLKMTKVTSTTEAGEDKFHYLFVHDGQTVIVGEFLFVNDEFAPILATFRAK